MKEKEKNIREIAEKIASLEKACTKNDVQDILPQMEELIQGLSLEDLLAIDEYIMEKKLLTK